MRIIYIAAGAAGTYCGACMRDVALVRGLARRGHDVAMLPLYTPLRVDGPDPSAPRIFYGGITAWLQQHSRIFRHTPRFIDWILDRRTLLRLVSRFAIETRPERLGDMTVSVLGGGDGRQRKELERLLAFLESGPRPDVVHLSNSLLAGVAEPIHERLGAALVCTLAGEESFVERLGEPHRRQAINLLRQYARVIDAFVCPGEGYADEMGAFLDVPRDRIHVIRPGIELETYRPGGGGRPRDPFRIGFLSRVSPAKGADLLVDAFIRLERDCPGGAVLSLAGQARGAGAAFLNDLRARIAAAGLEERFEYVGVPGLREKVAFLQRCSVFCVPSRHPERGALASLEAMAIGVPVVAPASGIFPEMAELAGGVILTPPADAEGLAKALGLLRDDPDAVARLGTAACEGVARHFRAEAMASATLSLYARITRR